MGAPANNVNAEVHGVNGSRRLARQGLRHRRQPPGCKYIADEVREYASGLAIDVEAARGLSWE